MIKDSGKRIAFKSGMKRDIDTGKPRFDLIDLEMLKRWAVHMGDGTKKYGERNWEVADCKEELVRFEASAFRHFIQWMDKENDEDHAAAVMFNIAAGEMVRKKLWTKK